MPTKRVCSPWDCQSMCAEHAGCHVAGSAVPILVSHPLATGGTQEMVVSAWWLFFFVLLLFFFLTQLLHRPQSPQCCTCSHVCSLLLLGQLFAPAPVSLVFFQPQSCSVLVSAQSSPWLPPTQWVQHPHYQNPVNLSQYVSVWVCILFIFLASLTHQKGRQVGHQLML